MVAGLLNCRLWSLAYWSADCGRWLTEQLVVVVGLLNSRLWSLAYWTVDCDRWLTELPIVVVRCRRWHSLRFFKQQDASLIDSFSKPTCLWLMSVSLALEAWLASCHGNRCHQRAACPTQLQWQVSFAVTALPRPSPLSTGCLAPFSPLTPSNWLHSVCVFLFPAMIFSQSWVVESRLIARPWRQTASFIATSALF